MPIKTSINNTLLSFATDFTPRELIKVRHDIKSMAISLTEKFSKGKKNPNSLKCCSSGSN